MSPEEITTEKQLRAAGYEQMDVSVVQGQAVPLEKGDKYQSAWQQEMKKKQYDANAAIRKNELAGVALRSDAERQKELARHRALLEEYKNNLNRAKAQIEKQELGDKQREELNTRIVFLEAAIEITELNIEQLSDIGQNIAEAQKLVRNSIAADRSRTERISAIDVHLQEMMAAFKEKEKSALKLQTQVDKAGESATKAADNYQEALQMVRVTADRLPDFGDSSIEGAVAAWMKKAEQLNRERQKRVDALAELATRLKDLRADMDAIEQAIDDETREYDELINSIVNEAGDAIGAVARRFKREEPMDQGAPASSPLQAAEILPLQPVVDASLGAGGGLDLTPDQQVETSSAPIVSGLEGEQPTPENSPIGGEVVEFTYPPSQGWLDAILRAARKWQNPDDEASGNVQALIQAGVEAGAITIEDAEQYLRERGFGRLLPSGVDTSHQDPTETHRPTGLDEALNMPAPGSGEPPSEPTSAPVVGERKFKDYNLEEADFGTNYDAAELAAHLGMTPEQVRVGYDNFRATFQEGEKIPTLGALWTVIRDRNLRLTQTHRDMATSKNGPYSWGVDSMGNVVRELLLDASDYLLVEKQKARKTVEVPDLSAPSAPEAGSPTTPAADEALPESVLPFDSDATPKSAAKTPGGSLWKNFGEIVGRAGRRVGGVLGRGRSEQVAETPTPAVESSTPPESTPSTEEESLGRSSVEGVRDELSRQVAMLKSELAAVKSAKANEKDHPEALRVEIRNAMATLFGIYTLLFEASEHNLNYLPVPSVTGALDMFNLANDHVLTTTELSDSLAVNLNMIAEAGREQPEMWREMVVALNLLEQDKKINLNSSMMTGLRAKLNSAAPEAPPRPEPPNPDSPPNLQESVLSPREEQALDWSHDGIKRQAEQFFEGEFNEISNWRNLDESEVCSGILGMVEIYVKIPDHWQEWVKRAGRGSLTTGINVPFFGADGRLQRGYISDADDYATMFRSLSNWYRTTMSGLDRNKLTADPFLNSSVNVNNLAEADRLFGNVE